jgi:hypothetical protein
MPNTGDCRDCGSGINSSTCPLTAPLVSRVARGRKSASKLLLALNAMCAFTCFSANQSVIPCLDSIPCPLIPCRISPRLSTSTGTPRRRQAGLSQTPDGPVTNGNPNRRVPQIVGGMDSQFKPKTSASAPLEMRTDSVQPTRQ